MVLYNKKKRVTIVCETELTFFGSHTSKHKTDFLTMDLSFICETFHEGKKNTIVTLERKQNSLFLFVRFFLIISYRYLTFDLR